MPDRNQHIVVQKVCQSHNIIVEKKLFACRKISHWTTMVLSIEWENSND